MPEFVAGAVVYLPVFLLVALAAAAVGVVERRDRTAAAAAGAPWPTTPGYRLAPALALARVEAGRLARHPAVWLGLAGAASSVASFSRAGLFADPQPSDLLLPVFAPLLLGLFAAVHLGVGRDRHVGMDELARTLPAGAGTRTAGHQVAAVWASVPLGVAVVATVLVVLGDDRTFGGWTPSALELAQPALAVILVAVLAVAVSRWWRHPVAAALVPLMLFFSPLLWGVALYMQGGPQTVWGTDEHLGTITATRLVWHLVFLGGYLTVAVAGALLRHDRRLGLLAVGAGGLVAMVAGYVIKLPPWHWLA